MVNVDISIVNLFSCSFAMWRIVAKDMTAIDLPTHVASKICVVQTCNVQKVYCTNMYNTCIRRHMIFAKETYNTYNK